MTSIATQRTGPGRPPAPPGLKRDKRVRTNLNDGERATLDAVLQQRGVGEAEWVREVLLAAAARELADVSV